jgi:hypothetical protein
MSDKHAPISSFTSLLTIVFITLKLCHVIEWSWLWVLSPLWFQALIILTTIIILVIIKWLTRPRTPEERVAAACNEMVEALKRNQP